MWKKNACLKRHYNNKLVPSCVIIANLPSDDDGRIMGSDEKLAR